MVDSKIKFIPYPTPKVLAQNIASLEQVALPTSPEDALTLWIRGQELRSGGIQYIALAPRLKEQVLKNIDAGHSWWVTGGSSPSFRNPTIIELSHSDPDTYIYQIDFDEIAGGEVFKTSSQVVTIKKFLLDHHTYWLIDNVTGNTTYYSLFPTTID